MSPAMKLVPDTSTIINGSITQRVESGEFRGANIIVPEAVVAELEAQANKGRETGYYRAGRAAEAPRHVCEQARSRYSTPARGLRSTR